ncbi:MAG: bifunctional UDP-N-acetylglucosamine diphosphorylase/glucosamine-1-phosphate N-acetyltransferase GlmU [Acidiferrobacterales bacterium]
MTASPSPPVEVVILAAGKGTRMHSDIPKVLHPIAGIPLVQHVILTAEALKPHAVRVVYGHGGELLPAALGAIRVDWVLQAEQKGTGHAVLQALPAITPDSLVLVLYGDVPLIRAETLRPLLDAAARGALALLTVELDDPCGYGRILRDPNGTVTGIVEQRDATIDQMRIREINTGMLAVGAAHLGRWLAGLRADNAQGEHYLTDIVAMAAADGVAIVTAHPGAAWEVMGVNSKAQLAELERIAQRNRASDLLDRGVTLMDPARFDLRGTLTVGRDVVIDVNVVIEGDVALGDRVRIGANNILCNCTIGADTIVHPNCVIEDSAIGDAARVGPFARVRPGSRIAGQAHIGNFVEIKKSDVGEGSKVNHLSYIGDSTVGRHVNIGAGTITANYDGANKHRTVIGDNASIGSDCTLVAPVSVGAEATVGANTTITEDVPPGVLAVGRVRQKIIEGWKRPAKKP